MYQLLYLNRKGQTLATIPLNSSRDIYELSRPLSRPVNTTSVVVRPVQNERIELVVWQSARPAYYGLDEQKRKRD